MSHQHGSGTLWGLSGALSEQRGAVGGALDHEIASKDAKNIELYQLHIDRYWYVHDGVDYLREGDK